jgi:hypothetical protein
MFWLPAYYLVICCSVLSVGFSSTFAQRTWPLILFKETPPDCIDRLFVNDADIVEWKHQ